MAVTNDLVTDQRADRHCRALMEVGCRPMLVGRMLDSKSPLQRPYPTLRMQLRNRRGWRFYAEYNIRLFRMLMKQGADIFWANDVDTLPACIAAGKLRRRPVVLDLHEMMPEVPEVVDRPRVQGVWRWVERTMIPRCAAVFTVCQSIADIYSLRYGIEVGVVRNLRSMTSLPEHTTSRPHMLLYQGAVNVGRGVDWAIEALQWLENCRLVIVGEGDLLQQMKELAAQKPYADRIEFVGRVEPKTLVEFTRRATVGLVMLEDRGMSYHYALPNRIGDFVAAGVPMVVSDLPEMANAIRTYAIGEVMTATGGKALADAVSRLIAEWDGVDDAERAKRFAKARAEMDWDKEKNKLIKILVVALMQMVGTGRAKTFSIGFQEAQYDESAQARAVAAHLGTDHYEQIVDEEELLSVIPLIPQIYGEPYADSSQIPTFLVSRLAKREVTVALSGDAGDELFCGYRTYPEIARLWGRLDAVPSWLRDAGSGVGHALRGISRKAYRAGKCMEAHNIRELKEAVDHYDPLMDALCGAHPLTQETVLAEPMADQLIYDLQSYHPEDILVKVDRAGMAVSLENRIPMLDRDVVAYALSLPSAYKYDGHTMKKVLKGVLGRYVPQELWDRPKKGFAVPLTRWLSTGRTAQWAAELMDSSEVVADGLLDGKSVAALWRNFRKKQASPRLVWNVLMMEQWYRYDK